MAADFGNFLSSREKKEIIGMLRELQKEFAESRKEHESLKEQLRELNERRQKMEQERQESEAAVQAERTATAAALLRGSETAAVAGQASEAGEYSTSAIQKANLGTEGESETTVEEERDATVDEQASESEGVFISEMKQLNLELVEDNRVTEEEWQKKSRSASMAEKTRTFEAEASPENLETTAVRAIQGETKVEASQKPEPEAEEKERVAAETERASSTVAIERFSPKLSHQGGWDFTGEPSHLGFPLMVMGSFQWQPPTLSDHAVRLLHEGGPSKRSRRLASRLLNPYPCRPPEGNQPPPEPPDLSVGSGEVFPLLVGHAEREGETHRKLGWRNTEVKVWTYNPNGPRPTLSWQELGLDEYWANFSAFGLKSNLPIYKGQRGAIFQVTKSQRILQQLWENDSGNLQAFAETMKLFTNLSNEQEKWDPGGNYFVPPFLTQVHSSFWSCQLHVFAEFVAGFQSSNSQITKFNVWVWRHQQIGDSWTFTQFGSLGGEFIFGADSLTGLLVSLLAGYGKLPTNSFVYGFALKDSAILLAQPVCINGIFCKLFWTLCFRLWDPGGSYDCLHLICGVAVHLDCL